MVCAARSCAARPRTDGPDKIGHVAKICKCISAARASISASKIITIGTDIAFMMIVSVPSDVVPSLSKALHDIGAERQLSINWSAIEQLPPPVEGAEPSDMSPVAAPIAASHRAKVELVGPDSPGLVHMVATLLSRHQLNIQSLDTRVYSGDQREADDSYPTALAPPTVNSSHAAAGDGALSGGRIQRTLTDSAETGVSRSLRAQAVGDLFCLSAIVATDHAFDMEALGSEIAHLGHKHGVRLTFNKLE